MKHNNDGLPLLTISKKCENGKFDLNYTYQRLEGQWSLEQKSLLIDSYIKGFPVDAITVAAKIKDSEEYYVIDGVQRATTIRDFVNNRFKLSKNIKPYDGEELAEKTYDELPQKFKDAFEEYNQSIEYITSWTEEELREVFRRKNNGKPLTKAQKMAVAYSDSLFEEINKITNLDEVDTNGKKVKNFWNRVISKSTHLKAEDRVLVMQCLMLVDKAMYVDGKMTKAFASGFTTDEIENYVAKFQEYSADVQAKLLGRVQNATTELTDAMNALESEIKNAKKQIRAIRKTNPNDDVSTYEEIVARNTNRLKSIKKLTVPMLVAGMYRAISVHKKGQNKTNYLNAVYELLDFLAAHSKRTEAERYAFERENEADLKISSFLKYYHNYNTQATASKEKVNGRLSVFVGFVKGEYVFDVEETSEEAEAEMEKLVAQAQEDTNTSESTEGDALMDLFMNAPNAEVNDNIEEVYAPATETEETPDENE